MLFVFPRRISSCRRRRNGGDERPARESCAACVRTVQPKYHHKVIGELPVGVQAAVVAATPHLIADRCAPA